MTQPSRQEIIKAYDALDALEYSAFKGAESRTEEEISLYRKNLIIAALPPIPRPVMADVEWDDDEHYLAEAEHQEYGLVTMIGPTGIRGYIQCAFRNDDGINTVFVNREYLTPTGRRYTPTQTQEN